MVQHRLAPFRPTARVVSRGIHPLAVHVQAKKNTRRNEVVRIVKGDPCARRRKKTQLLKRLAAGASAKGKAQLSRWRRERQRNPIRVEHNCK